MIATMNRRPAATPTPAAIPPTELPPDPLLILSELDPTKPDVAISDPVVTVLASEVTALESVVKPEVDV